MSQCNSSYSVTRENLKYFAQFVYLVPGVLFQLRILIVIWGTHNKIYLKSSFFTIWSLDSLVSLVQMFLDVSFTRIHIYFPQLCEGFSVFLEIHWMIPNIVYPFYLYAFTAKSVIHSFLSINRASCVLMPTKYAYIWRSHMKKVIVFILLYPFLLLWNVIISEKYLDFIFGGFVISYIKRVPWASLSKFQIISYVFTFSVTLVTNSITLSKMAKLKKRLLMAERHLCVATAWISSGFVISLIAQAHFAFFRGDHELVEIFYIIQCVSFDLLNVGSPIVMITLSRELRNHVFLINPSPVVSRSTSTFNNKNNISILIQ
ncbi:Serpentine receptor class gamma-4 [Caenorhabditis elegans]|uniref:Serpentine receptor class gamma-4 n=1 Tax=Caenorhabditis elegans TaxID=6239 RepID=SRG4_CAEEL|nr:Serpentine receptor class gamma-4 [Caenorhabditis elegans]P54126.2 RecName: Full=Serpentine receptor class gamma-4; Short=Protein srg-4 [Caenorhabditis elegans]CCD65217.1 Serpentine receptor class gamma-4 [Caenorhabditis elegans]|eukprot:NP_001293632.1 Serpentine receptor class gamma-4 [Caenorhabditis elegans]